MRVGLGYDIHRLVPGRALVLGGVPIPHETGLEGHSDADVVVHALMDAILGAASLGDIGGHFPPQDERFRDISSLTLLGQVHDLLVAAGFRFVNASVVVVAEQPRVGPFAREMQCRMSNALRADPEAIGIAATTNEAVGPEGRGEAISAQAVALIERLT